MFYQPIAWKWTLMYVIYIITIRLSHLLKCYQISKTFYNPYFGI